jgi:integrase
MKRKDSTRDDHEIPLPPLLLATVREWRKDDEAEAVMVCPAPRDKRRSITAEGVEKYYRDVLGLAGKHSPHSWRSAFSTVARNAGKADEVIKTQLDHQVGNKTDSIYDRATRLRLRRILLTWYEKQLIAARDETR